MADNESLINALHVFTNMISIMRALAAPLLVFDPFFEDEPFNFVTRLGAQACTYICQGLKESWDDIASSFHLL